jgi:hypothetical protein
MKINLLTIEYKKTLWASLMVLGVLMVGYLFFVSSSVFNTVALKDAEIKSSEIRSTLANLETKYILIEKNIDLEEASNLGYLDVETNQFSYNSFSSSVSTR